MDINEKLDIFTLFKIPSIFCYSSFLLIYNCLTSNFFTVRRKFSFGHSVWLIWVLLFRAATEVIQPTGLTSKFMSNVWALFCMAFMASYTANLAAFMITKEEFHDLKGIEDDKVSSIVLFQFFYCLIFF